MVLKHLLAIDHFKSECIPILGFYSGMEKSLFNRRDIAAYLIVAGTGFLIQLLAGSLLQEWFELSYLQALLIGYGVAFVSGFVLTKLFAFDARNSTQTRREGIKFTLVSVVSCLITVYGSTLLYRISANTFGNMTYTLPHSVKEIHLNKLGAQVIAMGLSFVNNYVLHKKFTFANTGFYERLKNLFGL